MLPLVLLSPLPVDYCFSLIFNMPLWLLCYFVADGADPFSTALLLMAVAAYMFWFAIAATSAASVIVV